MVIMMFLWRYFCEVGFHKYCVLLSFFPHNCITTCATRDCTFYYTLSYYGPGACPCGMHLFIQYPSIDAPLSIRPSMILKLYRCANDYSSVLFQTDYFVRYVCVDTCVCMYVYMYTCMCVSKYVCMHLSMYLRVCVRIYVSMYLCLCMYVSMYVSMYLCMYLCM
jgi:hypothetical protein